MCPLGYARHCKDNVSFLFVSETRTLHLRTDWHVFGSMWKVGQRNGGAPEAPSPLNGESRDRQVLGLWVAQVDAEIRPLPAALGGIFSLPFSHAALRGPA